MTTTPGAIKAGLVVRLDTTALRAQGGSHTNAELGAHGDRAVVGTHDFLVLYADAATGVCTAVPLFAKTAVGNQPLVEELKSGDGDGWKGSDMYFSRWQHWRIPTTAIEAAITEGETAASERLYAAHDLPALDDIRVWESRNRAPYRPA